MVRPFALVLLMGLVLMGANSNPEVEVYSYVNLVLEMTLRSPDGPSATTRRKP
jgi:hypothetical protein